MRLSHLVIDDFYEDPHAVRTAGLRATYQSPEDENNYPGQNSLQHIEVEGLDEQVSHIVHEPVTGTPGSGHCRFRLAMAGDDDRARLRMHVDGNSYWSGIVYLTLPEHCRGGTEFYRHRELASDHAPLYDRDVEPFGETSCAAYTKKIIARDSNDPEKWEHLMTVPMRFNRCILFRPWFWHTSGVSFGDRPENARLVQLLFFTLDRARRRAQRPTRGGTGVGRRDSAPGR